MGNRINRLRKNSLAVYSLSISIAILALLIRLALNRLIGHGGPFITFFLATAVVAATFGFWPGLTTSITGLVLSSLVIRDGSSHYLIDPSDPFAAVRYLVSGSIISLLFQGLITARERAEIAEHRLAESQVELLRQAEELKRSNRDLEQFAYVASHDLQEPLRTVNIYAELLLKALGPEQPPEWKKYGTFIVDGVGRMQRLTQDLLTYSRVMGGAASAHGVDSNAIAHEALQLCESVIAQSRSQVQIDPMPRVLTEEMHLCQLFQNLLSNAIKYRKPGEPATVRIWADAKDGEAIFHVRDSGIGFDQKYAPKVFELFARLNGRRYDGSGLGLAICQRIVERYGGRIWAESQPNVGSTFSFTLPTV